MKALLTIALLLAFGAYVYSEYTPEQIAGLKEAAENGNASAQLSLGYAYANGEGVPKDDAEAIKWYRRAANQGHALAQFNLGNKYNYGEGVPQDYKEAVKWYRKAAEQEYRKAAEQEHELEGDPYFNDAFQHYILEAQWRLGNAYSFGNGVPEDYTEAIKWYRMAAEQGHASSQWRLVYMYVDWVRFHADEIGEGVIEDKVQAYAWYRIAQANEEESAGASILAVEMTYEQLAEAKKLVGEMIMASPNLLSDY